MKYFKELATGEEFRFWRDGVTYVRTAGDRYFCLDRESLSVIETDACQRVFTKGIQTVSVWEGAADFRELEIGEEFKFAAEGYDTVWTKVRVPQGTEATHWAHAVNSDWNLTAPIHPDTAVKTGTAKTVEVWE
jgi:hypothetical protein